MTLEVINEKTLSKLIIVGGLIFTSFAYAGSGKAVVPHWMATGSTVTSIWVSNISSHNLDVTITFYDENGNKLSAETYYNFQNANTEVAAGKSGYVTIAADSYGYAVITWKNIGTDDDVFGLVAYGHRSGCLRSPF